MKIKGEKQVRNGHLGKTYKEQVKKGEGLSTNQMRMSKRIETRRKWRA